MNSATVKTLKVLGAILCGAVVVSAVWIALRWNAPPLRLVRSASRVTVNVSTLGEYPTTVMRIRLSEIGSRTVVWELSAENGVAQMHGFTLAEGENPAHVDTDHGNYRVLVPSDSASFALRKGTEYRLEVWGGRTVLTKKSAAFFVSDAQ